MLGAGATPLRHDEHDPEYEGDPAGDGRNAARIKAAGGAILDEPADRPWGVRMFHFKDLDGFMLGVSTPLTK